MTPNPKGPDMTDELREIAEAVAVLQATVDRTGSSAIARAMDTVIDRLTALEAERAKGEARVVKCTRCRGRRVVPDAKTFRDYPEDRPCPDCTDGTWADAVRTLPAAEGVREAAELAAMYLATGFIECPRCGHEVPTEHTDAEYALREALADQPTSLQKTQTSADQGDVAPERGR